MDKKEHARRLMTQAIERGDLVRKPCERCGATEPTVHGHHEDYDRPLDVVWLCQYHHLIRHNELARMVTFTVNGIAYTKFGWYGFEEHLNDFDKFRDSVPCWE